MATGSWTGGLRDGEIWVRQKGKDSAKIEELEMPCQRTLMLVVKGRKHRTCALYEVALIKFGVVAQDYP